jgi:hypothetical protein
LGFVLDPAPGIADAMGTVNRDGTVVDPDAPFGTTRFAR